ncbi:hypothetical protein [Fuchsiella alkaliacetigena]|uniref:hypothetical protein n=1 Tax=Fuchsiella alkaliacetigena TaxID=957042 RepID=UPI00200A51AC|nr:hypothetical protein [Fuchsiella alkaliacetigena]MCK8826070.1 hypothetical protein [Fuchsiella alkaliacetigena]
MLESINRIVKDVARNDEGLSSLLNDLLRSLDIRNEPERERSIIPEDIEDRIKRVAQRGIGRSINLIPSDKKGSCREYCLVLAFNKWNSKSKKKPGFKGVAQRVINYWLKCNDVNKGTIILTTAWDEKDFQEKFKTPFANYASDLGKTVAVILLTPASISIQYLK